MRWGPLTNMRLHFIFHWVTALYGFTHRRVQHTCVIPTALYLSEIKNSAVRYDPWHTCPESKTRQVKLNERGHFETRGSPPQLENICSLCLKFWWITVICGYIWVLSQEIVCILFIWSKSKWLVHTVTAGSRGVLRLDSTSDWQSDNFQTCMRKWK